MKERVTYTLDPKVSDAARQMARRRGLSTSAFVEGLIRSVESSTDKASAKGDFVSRWKGKIKLIRDRSDPRARRLLAKYGDEHCAY
jgi:hypothetical protein